MTTFYATLNTINNTTMAQRQTPVLIKRNSENLLQNCNITQNIQKRDYADAFHEETYDDERFGQHIGDEYFTNNIGHGIVVEEQQQRPTSPQSNMFQKAADDAIDDLQQVIRKEMPCGLERNCTVEEMIAWFEICLKVNEK